MRTAVGALAVVAAASGASAFAPQSSFVGRAPALRGAAIAPAQPQLAAPRDVSRKAISMDLDPWLIAAPGLVALGVALQNQMNPASTIATAGAAAAAPTKAAPSGQQMIDTARRNFQMWNDALQTKDPKAVARLYTTSGLSFLPTVSPKHIKSGDTTEDYFKDFVKKNPFGTITDDNVQVYDNGEAYLHTGMYIFELGDAGQRAPVGARFSYMWRKEDGAWKISHHHSSVVPATSNAKLLDTARANFQKWNDALQTKDPKRVAALYDSSNLSFLPTVSPKHIQGGDDTVDYFTDFVMKNPFGVITDDSVQGYEDGQAYLHTGLYTFELGDVGKRSPVLARFSYMWRKVGNDWKITHHHSSVRPAGPDMNALARENFGKWNSALQTKDSKKVAALYSTSLSFLPTVSPKHIKSGDLTEDYFKEFVLKNPFGTITDDSVQVYEDGLAYLHTGMYTFELGQGADRKPVAARFSYMWRKEGSDWKITHHHSSVVPGGAPKPGSEDPKKALLDQKKAEMGLGQPRRLFGSATLARMYYGEAVAGGK